ncbi:N-acetylmuramic acid 6-phosphate etherase [Ameyamaea chiangmaiensis]|uniref:N-acetylmuramic acid 6-phosphate etherase n=1 Tax=Ameyamaea chiangmaiensis TaxID=442969 RepID=A0A850PDQ3_9PROT|nr:N-acetylmuramic acid 6-phosphate etherase [Ameyamaea chiangmaiensis]MBS4075999.1 N-acetylmuramic acid 6-phosphate etherase [Ameyamaea chiangmaiensis]NVN40819.1 N-acetylmuramic acid 6-phosphate etherase [Ameyamaea chiangmaiensis]
MPGGIDLDHADDLTSRLPATEGFDPAFTGLDHWPTATQMSALWAAQLAAVAAIGPAVPVIAQAVEAAVPRLRSGGRLAYAGAGSSGRLGAQDGAELPPTFGWAHDRLILLIAGGEGALIRAVENAEDDRGAARSSVDAAGLGPDDVLIAVAASGRTPYTIACVEAARAAGALTIAVANSPAAPLLSAAHHAVLVETGSEPIAGSTRMKAGTAQKVVLNLLSTGMMTGLGHVHQGRMVDMQARNAKLRHRAVRMVADLAGCDAECAERALESVDRDIKRAVLVALGAAPAAAAAALRTADGRLHVARASLGLASSPSAS